MVTIYSNEFKIIQSNLLLDSWFSALTAMSNKMATRQINIEY